MKLAPVKLSFVRNLPFPGKVLLFACISLLVLLSLSTIVLVISLLVSRSSLLAPYSSLLDFNSAICVQAICNSLLTICTFILLFGLYLTGHRSPNQSSLSQEQDEDSCDNAATSVDQILSKYSGNGASDSGGRGEFSDCVEATICTVEPEVIEPVTYPKWDEVLRFIDEHQGLWQMPHLQELIDDRMTPLKPFIKKGNSAGKDDWARDAVDFYDELLSLGTSANADDQSFLSSLQEKLLQAFDAMGIEVLRESSWNPEIQRAISVEKTLPPDATPIIKEQGSSGIRCDGLLLRKQEVDLQLPTPL